MFVHAAILLRDACAWIDVFVDRVYPVRRLAPGVLALDAARLYLPACARCCVKCALVTMVLRKTTFSGRSGVRLERSVSWDARILRRYESLVQRPLTQR